MREVYDNINFNEELSRKSCIEQASAETENETEIKSNNFDKYMAFYLGGGYHDERFDRDKWQDVPAVKRMGQQATSKKIDDVVKDAKEKLKKKKFEERQNQTVREKKHKKSLEAER